MIDPYEIDDEAEEYGMRLEAHEQERKEYEHD